MKQTLLPTLLLLLCLVPMGGWCQPQPAPLAPYRPWVRWWWNGNQVDTTELKRELHLLHEAGIGGVEINPIEFPSKRCDPLDTHPLPWLSPQWLDALEATLREAHRLGMGCDLLVGSGWPFGTESLPMEHRAQVMLTYAVPVDSLPLSADGARFVTCADIFAAVDPQVTVPNPDRTFTLISLHLTPDSITSLSEVTPLPLPTADTLWLSPARTGGGVLYALVLCRSFASVINGAPGAAGPILDHFNQQAVQQYLDHMSSTLERRLGPMRQWLRAYFVDSMELEGSNWTSDFAAEFARRCGYDPMPWLPLIMFKVGRLGEVADYHYGARKSPAFEEQLAHVRLDYERTKAQLLDERYTQTFLRWCHRQGVQARAQAYGRGFFPLESSLGYDIPEAESWTTNYLRHRVGYEMGDADYRRGRAYTMITKYVASAAHISGRRVVSAEEMTNTYMLFNTSLELLKLGSDMNAFAGATHSVWHGFNYSPPSAGFPGWVQYGSYYNEQNPWWPYFRLLNDYRARMSRLLQGAVPVTPLAVIPPTEHLWAHLGVQTEPFPNYPRGSFYQATPLLWEAVHKNGSGCDLATPTLATPQRYAATLAPTPEGIVLHWTRRHRPDQLLPYPPDNHFLEWYDSVQSSCRLPQAVRIDRPDRFLLHQHLRTQRGDDMYLFVNAHLDQSLAATLTFPASVRRGRTPIVYDCLTGRRMAMPLLRGGECRLTLGPAESLVVVFERCRRHQAATLPQWQPADTLPPALLTLNAPWRLSLRHAVEGWTADTLLPQLQDLRQTTFPSFAGTATYTCHLWLDSAQCANARTLDLGRVHDICRLHVNGVDCGTLWCGLRHYPVAGLLHTGENLIEIEVTTLLGNYAHTLSDNPVVQHFVLKRSLPTVAAGLVGPVRLCR